MLNVALVGLLAGSLLTGPVNGPDDGDKDKDKDKKKAQTEDTSVPTPGVFDEASSDSAERSIVSDTYMMGFPSDAAPIKFWASYAFGTASDIWNAEGDTQDLAIAGAQGGIESQRIQVGAQINAVNFPAFKLGFGGELRVAQNSFKVADDQPAGGNPLGIDGLSSGYKLQNGKVYGTARGRVLGAHAGYLFDLGNADDENLFGLTNLTGDGLANSDGANAIFGGINFDYPSERARLFGGIDYYHIQDTEEDGIQGDGQQDDFVENANFLNFTFGGGVKLSAVEVGAALNIVNRFFAPTVSPNVGTAPNIGGHAGTISPYIRISPPSLPASIFVQGGVLDEYNTYGYAIGGANSIKPTIGFTAGVSVGFE